MDELGCFGETGLVEPNMITGLNTYMVAYGTGILEQNTGPVFFDQGYNPSADAFLWGRIDFNVIGAPGTSTDLITTPGEGGILNQGGTVPATFGGASISITSSQIPEPSIAFLLFAGTMFFPTFRTTRIRDKNC